MVFWVMLAVMTAAVVLVVIAPMTRPIGVGTAVSGDEAAVYRDQLKELLRDRDRGLIGGEDAEAARAEIGRRLIAASGARRSETAVRPALNRVIALVTVIAIPAMTLSLYLALGQPDRHDAPLAARLAAAPSSGNLADLVGRVEKHLEQDPNDLTGWRVLAPIYARTGRLDDAVAAWGRLVQAGETDTSILEDYGTGLVDTNDGIVSPEAQALLARVVAADPNRPRARFYYAEGLRQAGALDAALAQADELVRRSPANAPWLDSVRAKRRDILVALKQPADTPEPPTLPAVPDAAGPTAADVDAAASLGDADRKAMIEAMVAKLATRLADQPGDADGWVRLVRAYTVLGRVDAAKAALGNARTALSGDAAALAGLDATATSLGLTN